MTLGMVITCIICYEPESLFTIGNSFFSVIIGGICAIFGGIVPQIFIRNKEQRNKKIELKNEERRIANLITGRYGYFRLYIHHIVNIGYFHSLQGFAAEEPNSQHQMFNISKSYDARKYYLKLSEKLNLSFIEYYKAVEHFMSLTEQNDLINIKISEIQGFNIGEVKDFKNISIEKELESKRREEEKRLTDKLTELENLFNIVRTEMSKKM